MPRDFPDFDSLKRAAECHRFRHPNEGESEAEYRIALADHVLPLDSVEASEIRTGRGWDKQSLEELWANVLPRVLR